MDPKNKKTEVLHALSSALKSLTSWTAQRTMQECREACGGLGYSHYSNFGVDIRDHDVSQTWEGDNNVLF